MSNKFMRLGVLKFVLFLLIARSFSVAHAADDKMIHWLMFEWPPYMYQNASGQWSGYGSNFLHQIQKRLPQYNHTYVSTKFALVNDIFLSRDNVCVIGLFPTDERKQVSHFSLPDQVFPPMLLWLRDDTFEQLGSPNSIRLIDLIDNEALSLGLKEGVAYAKEIRDVLDLRERASNVLRLDQKAMTEPLVIMLLKKRIDSMLEYSDMLAWMADSRGIDVKPLKGVTIEETKNQLQITRVACSKSPWGKEVVSDLNEVLPELYTEDTYWNDFFAFISEEQRESVKTYLNYMRDHLDEFSYIP